VNVLVLGGYGLIGEALVRRLLEDGHRVHALGRDIRAARTRMPLVTWLPADMARLVNPADWTPYLQGIDTVVNAAGALQDGARDDLSAVHHTAVAALVIACEARGVERFVQISAVGVGDHAGDAFLSSKARGDWAVAESTLEWTILRPGLVIAPTAYGGTALLRALASFPFVVPAIMPDRMVQTVAVADVAEAVSRAVNGLLPRGLIADLVEPHAHRLSHVIQSFRAWLGYPEARMVTLPHWAAMPVRRGADLLGSLGWRSPLRSSALDAIERGVTGDPDHWRAATGLELQTLETTLGRMPANVQERWFARLWLLKPLILGSLALFWFVSGAIGLVQAEQSVDVLRSRGVEQMPATMAVLIGSLVDLVLGVAVLIRRTAQPALTWMLIVSAAYVVGATLVAPDLWLDPLGPIVKIFPAAVLAVIGLALLEER
jgi:uncharacterized protein YbjT (DUF2867 family)